MVSDMGPPLYPPVTTSTMENQTTGFNLKSRTMSNLPWLRGVCYLWILDHHLSQKFKSFYSVQVDKPAVYSSKQHHKPATLPQKQEFNHRYFDLRPLLSWSGTPWRVFTLSFKKTGQIMFLTRLGIRVFTLSFKKTGQIMFLTRLGFLGLRKFCHIMCFW